MLQVSYIAEHKEEALKALAKKGFDEAELVDEIIEIDAERRKLKFNLDETLAESNKLSKEIGELFKSGQQEKANEVKAQTGELKEKTKELNDQLHEIESSLEEKLVLLPNLPHDLVPEGKTPEDNEVVRKGGTVPELTQKKPHWELMEQYDLVDLELGNKITGAGFPVYKKQGAKLQRALISYFLDSAIEAGYEEVIPPHMVNEESAFATGQLPDKEGQMYEIGADKLYLIPTAEVPVTNIFRDVILEESDFPLKRAAYSPCFRREAGSYGKDVRGLNRVHQFDKVEIVQVQHPDKSYETLDEMVAYVEGILQKLGLPYRILRLCGGDMSFASAMTYDFEVYSTAQERWLEVSSVSNFETFQSNRMKLRFRGADKKTHLAHTLNGSALALPRIVAAILENCQTADGINIPEVLRPYTGFDKIG